ncbi:sensor histidine kinase [Oerskovia flava]|uniref:sensor histidine kinase n=1 Tax=Oerskovia flava TaxID=2986422 RepID=UPI00223FD953|nr:ATP-binding protein [Oerskovia sp. JB1-3-2]
MSPGNGLRQVSLRRRLGGLLVASGVVLLAVLTTSAYALAKVAEAQEEVTGPYFEAITQADGAYVALLDAELAVRTFLTTGQPVALEAFERSLDADRRVALHDEDIATSLGAHRELVGSLGRADDAIVSWLTQYADPVVEATREGGVGSVSIAEQREGAELFWEARSETATYIAELRSERLARVEALENWTRVLFGSVLVLVVAAVIVGAVLWVVLKRWVTEPVTDLAHDVRVVSSGHLERPITTTGVGEIAALADDVERMRTELVRQVEEIRTSHEEVEHSHTLLADQARELERSNRDLEQFAYVASHDLQEPLRKVASFTQLLKKRYGGQLDERADQYIDFAVDGAKRMQRLIQDLLGFSRVGRTGAERVEVDLEETFTVVLSDLAERIDEAGATVTHDRLPVVRGEPALLAQLFVNLVGNALKFRDPARPPQIHVGVVAHESSWELSCTDNGIGVDPQYADRVFVIFQRLHPKDLYEGTGIGLALCKRIVEYHGGRIWIEPRPDAHGTTVRWTLAHEIDPEVRYAHPDRSAAQPTGTDTTDGGSRA